MFTVQIKVMPLKELLDPQGKAVMGGLENLGLSGVEDVRVGKNITLQVSHAVEILAAVIIGLAVIKTMYNYATVLKKTGLKITREAIRVQFGRSGAVSLELLLGADVLATAVAPSWNDIGKLAAVAVIRTLLNYFLGLELKHIQTKV